MSAEYPLARIQEAHRLLAEARSIDEVKDIRDKAEAIRLYTKQAGFGLDIQNYAAEIKVRAERKAGELLIEMPKNEGGPERVRLQGVTAPEPPTLEDIGVSKIQSHRWQKIAEVPEIDFERHVAETKAQGQPLTTAGVIRLADEIERDEVAETLEILEGTDGSIADTRLRHTVLKGVKEARELFRLRPEAVADVVSSADYVAIQVLENDADVWFAALRTARMPGLHVVSNGERSL